MCDEKPRCFATRARACVLLLVVGGVASCDDSPLGTAAEGPQVEILQPSNLAEISADSVVNFGANVSSQDGSFLPSQRIHWDSDIDGALGEGTEISNTLSTGTHWIILEAMDDRGRTGRDSITVLVVPTDSTTLESPITPADTMAGFMVGQIVIMYGASPSRALIAEINRAHGLESQLEVPDLERVYVARVPAADSAATVEAAEAISAKDSVAFAGVNAILTTDMGSTDYPSDGEQYHIDQLGVDILWGRMVSEGFSSIAEAGAATVIAVIDRGFYPDIPELSHELTKIVRKREVGVLLWDDDPDSMEGRNSTASEHGTLGATISAGSALDGNGRLGVAPGAQLILLKVSTHVAALRAINHADRLGADVINVSLGDGWFCGAWTASLLALRWEVNPPDALVVASSGNDGYECPESVGAFARQPEVLAVGATAVNGHELMDLPSYQKRSRGGSNLDVVAPGVSITAPCGPGATCSYHGTSYSAPIVSGLAALYLSRARFRGQELSAADLTDSISAHTLDIGPEGWDRDFGHGRVIAGLEIGTVQPSEVNAGESVQFNVAGRNFHRRAQVKVGYGGQEQFIEACGECVSADGTTLILDYSVPTNAETFTIEVLNPGGLESNGVPITVTGAADSLGTGFDDEQFVLIEGGTFEMGDITGNGFSNELPVHTVNITEDFYLQKTEVTQAQWREVMGSNPSNFTDCGETCPVEQVSWEEIQVFIDSLNVLYPGRNYRLPTEAEWEYAARAGTTGDYGGTGVLDDMGWYNGNSGSTTHPVARKQPNHWGLYDMHGNVFELVQDWHASGYYSVSPTDDPQGPATGSARVLRGGSYGHYADAARSASRGYGAQPTAKYGSMGFRLLLTP